MPRTKYVVAGCGATQSNRHFANGQAAKCACVAVAVWLLGSCDTRESRPLVGRSEHEHQWHLVAEDSGLRKASHLASTQWRFNLTNGVELGAPQDHGRVVGAWILSDTTFVVADAQAFGWRLYDAKGHLVRHEGRNGRGPGEFIDLRGGFARDGEIWLYDAELNRISVWSAKGGHLRAINVSIPSSISSVGAGSVIGAFRDGSFVLTAGIPDLGLGLVRRWTKHIRYYGDGRASLVVAAPGADNYSQARGEDRVHVVPPFAYSTGVGIHNDTYYLLDSQSGSYRKYSWTGDLQQIVGVGVTPRPLDPDDLERVIRASTEGLPDSEADLVGNLLRSVPTPATYPVFGTWRRPASRFFVVGSNGELWIRLYTRPSDKHAQWHILDTQGNRIASLALSEKTEVLDVRNNQILVANRDDSDVARLWVYTVARSILNHPSPR